MLAKEDSKVREEHLKGEINHSNCKMPIRNAVGHVQIWLSCGFWNCLLELLPIEIITTVEAYLCTEELMEKIKLDGYF